MKGWLTLHWRTIQTHGAEQFLHSLSSTEAEIPHNGINHANVSTPLIGGTIGFIQVQFLVL